MNPDAEFPQRLAGDDAVLMLAEHFLNVLRCRGQPVRPRTERGFDGLHGVPQAFRGLADLVVPVVALALGGRLRCFGLDQPPEALEGAAYQLGHHRVGRTVGERA